MIPALREILLLLSRGFYADILGMGRRAIERRTQAWI
jgi:hypothetical protein